MTVAPLRALPLAELRQRQSAKWRTYPEDVLPLFVAETDYPLAPAIAARLARAVELGDTGYMSADSGIREAYVGFAQRRFGWSVDPTRIRLTGDVMTGIVELLRRVTRPGDRVVVTPPVYPPFFTSVAEVGATVERVPLNHDENGWSLDLAGIEAALRGGARVVMLCNPHNPTGTVHSKRSLAGLADLAAQYGATVISDEIHAPLTLPGATFTPFLAASETAAKVGLTATSASKAFNLPGLKCALLIAAGDAPTSALRSMPAAVDWRTGLFGVLAGVEAFTRSDEWLDAELAALDENRALLGQLLAEHVPGARCRLPDAGYLAWIDLRELGWGDDPARRILQDAKVALHFGPNFGDEGRGHVRINFACSPEVLTEAITRIGALVDS